VRTAGEKRFALSICRTAVNVSALTRTYVIREDFMSLVSKRWGLFPAVLLLSAFMVAPAAAADEEEDPFYEGFMFSNVLYLSQANLSIGILGDSVAKKAYEGELGATVAAVHAQFALAAQKQYLKIAESDDGEDDADLLKKMAKAAGHIREQADAVIGIAKGDATQGAAFAKAREATQKLLAEIEKEAKEATE
jgi:hypothetical protein